MHVFGVQVKWYPVSVFIYITEWPFNSWCVTRQRLLESSQVRNLGCEPVISFDKIRQKERSLFPVSVGIVFLFFIYLPAGVISSLLKRDNIVSK